MKVSFVEIVGIFGMGLVLGMLFEMSRPIDRTIRLVPSDTVTFKAGDATYILNGYKE